MVSERKASIASKEVGEQHSHRNDNIEVQDEDRLAALGYRQDLNRDWSLLQNFGVSFSIIVSYLDCT
jgi:hypothetical protein